MVTRAEEYRAAAENVVSQLREDLGVELKYDEASIEWLDGYINRMRTQLKKEAYLGLATALGAYVGETIIKTYGGGWAYFDQTNQWGIRFDDGNGEFDLCFCRQDGSAPSIPELKEYFSASPFFQVSDVAAGGVQFWYQNEATGVYCDFSYSPLDANELEGCGSSGLTFNLNYSRPSFFAYETMPLVEAFCERFHLVVEDPQEETTQPAEAARLITSWRAHNARAMGAMTKEEDMELHYLPEQRATEWWRYMSVRQSIEDALSEDIFVPSLMILMSQKLFRTLVWPKRIAQFFPPGDYVYIQREKKRMFGTKEETGLVPYQSVLETIEPLLDDYEFGGLQIKYLSPEKTPSVAGLIQTLHLEPVDLSRYIHMSSYGFHDVAVPGELP